MIAQYAAIFFHEFIAEKFRHKPDIYNFLIRHERKQKCLEGICEQIKLAELSNIGQRMDMKRLQILSRAGARMFCDAALKHAEESTLSQSERSRRISEHKDINEIKSDLIDRDVIKDSHGKAD